MGHHTQQFLSHYRDLLVHGPGILVWGLAFLAGAVGCLVCPFTLPTALGLSGLTGVEATSNRSSSRKLIHAFVAGLVLAITILGGVAGYVTHDLIRHIRPAWSLLLVALALSAAFVLFRTLRSTASHQVFLTRYGFGAAFVAGMIYSVGTPLAGLLLVLVMATANHRPEYGMLLAFGFGLGRALPFWVTATFVGRLAHRSCSTERWSRRLRLVGGILLLGVAGYYLWLSRVLL